jgi:hypothetical protein
MGQLQPTVPLPQQSIRRDDDIRQHIEQCGAVGSDDHPAAVGRAAWANEAAATQQQQLAAGAATWARNHAVVLQAEDALVSGNGDVSGVNATEH